ncbi:Proton-dependent oligopeptide transporter [Parasponia andersonii]|uniref:Proton-dependent oligopeptide transporter n=1 Tax=Parasponia andersonii TaxID=3476 RepID=A0A2P5D9Z6_PARAD|nr:Proton-dependent oligopeptide transporter [Parasponia andersonii]
MAETSGDDLVNGSTVPIKSGRRGGNRAALFVYFMESLENMAFVSNAVSLVLYFFMYMNYSLSKSSTMLTNLLGTASLLSLVGGFISDTYLNRFTTCVLFACIEFVGYILLLVQAHRPELRPPPCLSITHQCEGPSTSQAAMLFIGLYLLALGTGGVKATLPALGADQFDERDPKEASQMSSYFNWFLFSLVIGSILGVTLVVWISTNKGWDWAFGVCTMALFLSIVFISSGKPFYRNNAPKGSPLLRFARVFVACIRNRKLPIPENSEELHENYLDKEVALHHEILKRTDQFKFLDRAAVIRRSDGGASMTTAELGQWRLCTVTEVEETKILIRMLPIILSTVFMNTCLAQLQTFSVQQSTTLDRNVIGFKIPGPSIPVLPLIVMFILIPIYDRIFVPIARKFTGIPTGIRHLQRVGVGLVLSAISMTVAGFVEKRRKRVAIDHGMVDSPLPLPMSVFWLGFQYVIFGAADMFTLVGMLEFFYAESSAGMKALGTAISWTSMSFGYFLSTVVVEIVNKVSGGWLANNNLNRDKLENFYWLLAVLSVLNFAVYVLCASWYKYKKLEPAKKDDLSQAN